MTPPPEDEWLARAVARIGKLITVLAVAGTLIAFGWRGWKWGAGFAAGAAISWLNFRWLKQLTEALGGKRIRRANAIFLAFRYLVLGGAAYVILRFTQIATPALLAGLFVSIAAVIGEIIFELFRD